MLCCHQLVCCFHAPFTDLQPACVMQVEWADPEDPTKGFKYLYLKDDDYQRLWRRADRSVVKASSLRVDGELHGIIFHALTACRRVHPHSGSAVHWHCHQPLMARGALHRDSMRCMALHKVQAERPAAQACVPGQHLTHCTAVCR